MRYILNAPFLDKTENVEKSHNVYVIYIKTRLIIQVSYVAQSFSLEMLVKSGSNYVVVLNS